MFRLLLVAVVAAACTGAPQERPTAWSVETFFSTTQTEYEGLKVSDLRVKRGEELPWRGSKYQAVPERATADALPLHPAFADGVPAAYVITELWHEHPDPWVQPVYILVRGYDGSKPFARHAGKLNIFGVGLDSTFYSPYWRGWFADIGQDMSEVKDVAKVSTYPQHRGSIVTCPITRAGVGIASSTRPLSQQKLDLTRYGGGLAYVNGEQVEYLTFGSVEQEVNAYRDGEMDGTVSPAPLHMFVRLKPDGARELLPLPAVLPREPHRHAYVRRVDVVLEGEVVFVPAANTALRDELKGLGLDVPDAGTDISDAAAEPSILRVARRGSCFASAAAFDAGCPWLDSQEAIEAAIPASRRIETGLTLSANPLAVVP